MATSFAIPIREVAKHLNAFASGNASTTQTNYTTATPTVTQVIDPYFNLDFIKDKIVDAHGRLAVEIANVRAHPWRSWITPSVTAALTIGDLIPTTASSKTIVGAYGEVIGSGILLIQANPQRVQQYLNNASLYPLNPYLYYIEGGRIYHTVAAAAINVCTYERADAVSSIGGTPPGNITIPDVLVDALVAGATASCLVEAKGMEQAAYFQNIFDKAIQSIREGQTTMPRMTLVASP